MDKAQIMKERAHALAREPLEKAVTQERLEIIGFVLASETYAVEMAFVREVVSLKEFTPVPGMPPFILGIVNVRGQILSVVDLKKFFSLPEMGLGQLNTLIILRNDQMEFGILADDLLGVWTIPVNSIRDVPPTVSGIGAQYLRGVTPDHAIILDAGKIITDGNIIVNQGA